MTRSTEERVDRERELEALRIEEEQLIQKEHEAKIKEREAELAKSGTAKLVRVGVFVIVPAMVTHTRRRKPKSRSKKSSLLR